MGRYDKSSKWLIEHHGDSILRLAGVTGIAWWRALQAELVHPRRLPDGRRQADILRRTLIAIRRLDARGPRVGPSPYRALLRGHGACRNADASVSRDVRVESCA
jgi:hypothetical protein